MPKALKSEDPPIYSADGVALDVGATVYGVDTDCRNSRLPAVEPLVVAQVDLGVRRQVRLRRERGTEWVWNAEEHRGSCNTADHYIYASFDAARSAAVSAAEKHIAERLDVDLAAATEELREYEEEIPRSVKQSRDKIAKLKASRVAYAAQVSALRKQKKPSRKK